MRLQPTRSAGDEEQRRGDTDERSDRPATIASAISSRSFEVFRAELFLELCERQEV